MNNGKRKNGARYFALILFIYTTIMAFCIPTWQTPDEYTHLELIGTSISNDDFAKTISESVGIERGEIEFHPEKKEDVDTQKESLVKSPSYSRTEVLPKGVKLSIITHFPATMGIIIAILIGLPTYWVLQFGEIFSLLFYAFISYRAYKKMPVKKTVFAMIMILPMALQQAGGLGYDSVVLPLCYYLIAEIFYLKYEKQEVCWKDIFVVLSCFLLISYIKLPYAFLVLLFLMIPLEKFNLPIGKFTIDEQVIHKWRIPVVIVGCVVLVVGVYVLRDNRWIQIVYGFCVEWKRGFYLVLQTVITWHQDLITGVVGNFGWLDTPISYGYAIFVLITIFVMSFFKTETTEYKLRTWDRFILIAVTLILLFFTFLSMANHTIMVTLYGAENLNLRYDIRTAMYQIPYIGGLQGRYFLPIMFLPILITPQIKTVKRKWILAVSLLFEVITLIYVLILLLMRYWIA